MYVIKEFPEDFVVNEVSDISPADNGKYIYFWLTKNNYTLIRALDAIATQINLKLKNFGFAGTKDKKAITRQLISVYGTTKHKLDSIILKDIKIEFFGYGNDPISLGNLKGNEFIITIRNYDGSPDLSKNKFINYFGEQRFSRNNYDVGKQIIKKDFKRSVELVLESDGDYETKMRVFLNDNPNNYIGALKIIPSKILRMFVHAYQSYIWNLCATHFVDCDLEKIPIVGFGTEFENVDVERFIKQILKEDNINLRDFIIRQIPDLSSEGTKRQLFIETNIALLEHTSDKIKIKFTLPKGSYATEVIRQLF